MSTYILGISAYYHDSAACLVKDGEIIAAAQEERFTRKKHDESYPENAIAYCLKEAGIEKNQLDYVGFYEKPFLKFERLLETYLAYAPKGFAPFLKAIPVWLKEKLWIKDHLYKNLDFDGKLIFPNHHESHAASAFFPSPFEEAAYLTIDGVGEWQTTSFGIGKGNKIECKGSIHFPHSLGLLYSAFTYYTGFRVNSGEYKVMGLAPYGEPVYRDIIMDKLIDLKEDGSYKLNMEYFNYCEGLTMTNKKFDALFGRPPRKSESKLEKIHIDLAKSIQVVTEEVVLKMAKHVRETTGMKNLCMAGGVALNSVANGKLLASGIFDDIWIQPAAGDAGGAVGTALFIWHHYLNNKRELPKGLDHMKGSYLGPGFTDSEIEEYLKSEDIPYRRLEKDALLSECADILDQNNVIGWFNGRMEYGPRALGARSIIGDARSTDMQKTLNLKIKFREGFRPFAPSVLASKTQDYFDHKGISPYMLMVSPVKQDRRREMTEEEQQLEGIDKLNTIRSELPAITHVDYSARLQTVHEETNPDYYGLIKIMDERYNCPVIINTSFNVRGEPIVCTPADAYACFMRTNMDYLVIDNYLLDKKDQPEDRLQIGNVDDFELD